MHLASAACVADVALRAAAQAAAGPSLAATDAWVALASNATSFLVLSSVFIGERQWEAASCYCAGLAGSVALLLQAGALGAAPPAVCWAASALALGSAATNAAKVAADRHPAPAMDAVWRGWRCIAGAAGWAMVPQVAYLSLVLPAAGQTPTAAAAASWGPAAVSLALFSCLGGAYHAAWLPRACWRVWDVPAWTATLLFMMEPLAALAAAARDPAGLAGLQPAAFLLPALATGLQVPRALLAREHMWTTGTSWATLFACVQAALAAAAAGHVAVAAGFAAAPLVGAAWVLAATAGAEGHRSPLAPLQPIIAAYGRQQRPWLQVAARLRSTARRGVLL